MPRTGTQSLKHALDEIGYHTYGMGECIQWYSHMRAFRDNASTPGEIDYAKVLAGYDAIVGMPAFAYYEHMLALWPDAKVILSPREASGWVKSYKKLRAMLMMLRRRLFFVPRIRAVVATADAVWFSAFFEGRTDDAYLIDRYERYNQQVIDDIPADQLLIWTVHDGWEPLCSFLGEPVPDRPFPWANKNESEVKKRVAVALSRDLGYLLLGAGLVALVIVVLRSLLG